MTCRLDRKKNRKIVDWHLHHVSLVDEWDLFEENVVANEEPHDKSDFKQYQAWYQGVTRPRLRLQWTEADYADIQSSEDEDTAYDRTTRIGSQVDTGPILDRVVSHLLHPIPGSVHWSIFTRLELSEITM